MERLTKEQIENANNALHSARGFRLECVTLRIVAPFLQAPQAALTDAQKVGMFDWLVENAPYCNGGRANQIIREMETYISRRSAQQAEPRRACVKCGALISFNNGDCEYSCHCNAGWKFLTDVNPPHQAESVQVAPASVPEHGFGSVEDQHRRGQEFWDKQAHAPSGDVIERMYEEFDNEGGTGNYRAAMTAAYKVAIAGMVSLDAIEKCVGAYLLDEHGWNVSDALFAASKVRARLTAPSKTPEEKVHEILVGCGSTTDKFNAVMAMYDELRAELKEQA